MKGWKLLYCGAFFALCLVPSAGMFFAGAGSSSENRNLAELPSLQRESGLNVEYLSELGDYFQEHFAFRNELVTANALINGKLLGTSTASGVIQGTDGWLYYTDSLADYLGTEPMSDRSLYNIAHTLAMMQKELEKNGINFLFTVAPNKNSLYDEYMPYYDRQKVSDEKNLLRLEHFLEEEGVSYTDLYALFSAEDEVLYHARDSHWNNRGAAMAAEALLTDLGKEHVSYTDAAYEVRTDFEGDLDKMLYPLAMTPEEEIYYTEPFSYEYVEEIGSTFDPRIHTKHEEKDGSLVMYRDSFGNALLPFLAEEYGAAYFSRGVPYQLMDVGTNAADTVIVERAERFLPDMAQSPPVMTAVPVTMPEDWTVNEAHVTDGAAGLKVQAMGLQYQITGTILPEYLDTDTGIYVRVGDAVLYEAFLMDVVTETGTDDGGFCLYVPSEMIQAVADSAEDPAESSGMEILLEVLCEKDEQVLSVYRNTVKEEKRNEK